MSNKLLVILVGTLTATCLAPVALADSIPASSSEGSAVTLSGESLRTVNPRNASDDFGNFFLGTSPIEQTGNETAEGATNSSGGGFQLNEQLELVVGDTLDSREALNLFPLESEPGDSQRVKLQVDLSD